MTRRAAIYVRISKDRAGAGLGVARQRRDCEALAASLAWSVVDVYSDNDISAYAGKPRPEYQRMLTDLKRGRVNAVIAWHPDRLHRRPVELEPFIDVVEAAEAVVKTCTAGELDLSTPSGRMVARMLGAAARHEVEHAIERMRSKQAELRAAGLPRGGVRPFGYLAGMHQVNKAEADA
jgi:DNA invertase Pin-like site-specific DNA recombinase